MADLELKVHLKSGTIVDCTEAVTKITWSGDIKSPSRTLDFDILQAVYDREIESLGITEGDTVSFFEKGKELFRGILIDVDKDSSDNEVKLTAKDIGFFLKNKVAFNFNNVPTEKVASDVIKKLGYKAGSIVKTGQKYTKVVTNSTGYDVIMSAYTEASKSTNKKYMVTTTIDKFNVIEKGVKVLELEFNEEENLLKTQYKISLDKMVTRVLVTDKNGNKVSEKIDKELEKLYKVVVNEIEQQTEGGNTNNKGITKPEKSASLTGIGDTTCISGFGVNVKDSHTGLVGKFFIDSDKHTWTGGDYEIDMELNFENIMDEKEITESKNEGDSTSSGGGQVLNGKKVKARYSAYCPKAEGSIGGGNTTASGEKIDYSKKTCAAPKEIPFGTLIQIVGTGTKYDGQTFRVNDRGGAIKIINGVYRFDLLLPSGTEMNNFGMRNGYVIIGDGTGYHTEGGSSRAVELAKSQLGKPYKWGATGESSYDCSGLVYWVAKKLGKTIPRTSKQQSTYGQAVSKSNLQAGDCVFFANKNGVHHVGIYIGNGEYIHAPQTGDVVKISKLSSRSDYHNARRFL